MGGLYAGDIIMGTVKSGLSGREEGREERGLLSEGLLPTNLFSPRFCIKNTNTVAKVSFSTPMRLFRCKGICKAFFGKF